MFFWNSIELYIAETIGSKLSDSDIIISNYFLPPNLASKKMDFQEMIDLEWLNLLDCKVKSVFREKIRSNPAFFMRLGSSIVWAKY